MLSISSSLPAIVRLGVLEFDDMGLTRRHPDLDPSLGEAEARTRARPPDGMSSVRTMYKRVGLDPTKHRPSSEALLRRVTRGEGLPRINPLVDVCNWCSLESQLPYGVYDRARIQGDVELRLGRAGEEYAGIRKDMVHLEGRLMLGDANGPFGNPSSDSARTQVTPETASGLIVMFAPTDVAVNALERVMDLTASRIAAMTGGRETARQIVG
jgi:DNA/RNA-binding domain of Phe-tRNA-synthetase-like protein